MKFGEYVLKAIGLVWRFITTVFIIYTLAMIAFVVFLILMPTETMNAIEFVKSMF